MVEESRETIAQALNCRPGEVVFTSGGTEADNLALKGIYWSRRAGRPAAHPDPGHLVEHHAVLDPLHWLADSEGAEVELLPVDGTARLDVDALRAAVERDPESVAADLGDVGQQRGRHPAADRRGRRDRGARTASRCTPTRSRRSARCRSTSPPPASTR